MCGKICAQYIMVNHQFLNDVCNGDMQIYRRKSMELYDKHWGLIQQLKDEFNHINVFISITYKIINEVYDLLLYGSNKAYKDAYESINFIKKNGQVSESLYKKLLEFDILYYLDNDDIF
jgi:hypothetical protein